MAASDNGGPGPDLYQLLGDPARRAAYDRTLERQQPAPRIPAPPVRVKVRRAAGPDGRDEEIRLAVLAELALRYLARERDWPW